MLELGPEQARGQELEQALAQEPELGQVLGQELEQALAQEPELAQALELGPEQEQEQVLALVLE